MRLMQLSLAYPLERCQSQCGLVNDTGLVVVPVALVNSSGSLQTERMLKIFRITQPPVPSAGCATE